MDFFKDSSIKKELVRLLDEDKQVRQKVWQIVMESEKSDSFADDSRTKEVAAAKQKAEREVASLRNELTACRKQVEDLQLEKRKAETEAVDSYQQLEILKKEYTREKDSYMRDNSNLSEEITSLKSKCMHLEDTIEKKDEENKELKGKLSNVQADYRHLEDDFNRAKGRLAKQEEELNARFRHGWGLFEQYSNISANTRESLKRVFARESDFSSFISCASQYDALEDLWEIMRDCWDKKMTNDLKILREIFYYSLELVNKSSSKNILELLEVKPGDKYERKEQLLEPLSETQGRVHQVCIQGFRNVNTGKIIRQSYVNLE